MTTSHQDTHRQLTNRRTKASFYTEAKTAEGGRIANALRDCCRRDVSNNIRSLEGGGGDQRSIDWNGSIGVGEMCCWEFLFFSLFSFSRLFSLSLCLSCALSPLRFCFAKQICLKRIFSFFERHAHHLDNSGSKSLFDPSHTDVFIDSLYTHTHTHTHPVWLSSILSYSWKHMAAAGALLFFCLETVNLV